jgi:hypothetical protein
MYQEQPVLFSQLHQLLLDIAGCMIVLPMVLTPVPTSTLPAALLSAHAISPPTSIADKVAFYHAALFSPALSTWCDTLDAGYLTTWPSPTSAQVRRHFTGSGSIPIHLGHMDQSRANTQSTKPSPDSTANSDTKPPLITKRTDVMFVDMHLATGKVLSDQTGRFTTTSTSGNTYLMVIYDYDSNFIHVEPLKSRSGPCILTAYQKAHAMLLSWGRKPQLQ